jgi:hypothetical protein
MSRLLNTYDTTGSHRSSGHQGTTKSASGWSKILGIATPYNQYSSSRTRGFKENQYALTYTSETMSQYQHPYTLRLTRLCKKPENQVTDQPDVYTTLEKLLYRMFTVTKANF